MTNRYIARSGGIGSTAAAHRDEDREREVFHFFCVKEGEESEVPVFLPNHTL